MSIKNPRGELFFYHTGDQNMNGNHVIFFAFSNLGSTKLNCTFDVDLALAAGFSLCSYCFEKTQILVPQ